MSKIKKLFNNKYMPFVLLICALFVLHFFMRFFADDVTFLGMKQSLFSLIRSRYMGWSSRFVIESFIYFLVRTNMWVWKILDIFIYTMGVFIVLKLINKKDDVRFNYLGCLLFLIYPFADMSSAGWIATTTNYLWCFGLGMLSFLPLVNKEKNEKTNKFIYVVSILALVYATNQEQSCAIILGINILYLINTYFIKKEKINKYNLICVIISILSFIFIMTCPGNSVRLNKEIGRWLPQFKNANIIQKLYFGIVPTMRIFLDNKLVLILFSGLLLIGVFVYAKYNFSKIIAIFNFLLVVSLTMFRDIIVKSCAGFVGVFESFESDKLFQITHITELAALFITIIIFASLIYMVFVIFKDKLLPAFILLAGIASRVIMGFSPTIFASRSRTTIFMYMTIIVCMLFVLFKLFKDKKIKGNQSAVLIGILLLFVMINYINSVILSTFGNL